MNTATAMRRDSARERVLDAAESAVLQKGFAATSIDELIAATGLSKSGFFYHFKDKGDLAKALIQRYLERDRAILNDLFRRGDELDDDPLRGFLIGLKLFADLLGDLPGGHPGCLAASFCYQEQLFNREVRELGREGYLAWRRRFRERFGAIAERYPPRVEVDLDALADAVSAIVDGGITLSKALKDPALLPRQVLLFRALVRAVFAPD